MILLLNSVEVRWFCVLCFTDCVLFIVVAVVDVAGCVFIGGRLFCFVGDATRNPLMSCKDVGRVGLSLLVVKVVLLLLFFSPVFCWVVL